MTLAHKTLDCVQVAISTDHRDSSVTSLVDCTCTYIIILTLVKPVGFTSDWQWVCMCMFSNISFILTHVQSLQEKATFLFILQLYSHFCTASDISLMHVMIHINLYFCTEKERESDQKNICNMKNCQDWPGETPKSVETRIRREHIRIQSQ